MVKARHQLHRRLQINNTRTIFLIYNRDIFGRSLFMVKPLLVVRASFLLCIDLFTGKTQQVIKNKNMILLSAIIPKGLYNIHVQYTWYMGLVFSYTYTASALSFNIT